MRKILLLLLTVALPAASSIVAADGDGGYAGSFLQVPVGARPAAMGGAYRAISDDGAGPLYNPSGVASVTGPLFSSSYRVMKLDRTLGYIGVLLPTSHGAVLGVNWLFSSSGSVAGRNKDGDKTGDDWTSNNHSIGFVFSKRIEDAWAMGAKVSYLYSELGKLSTFAVGADLGFTFYASELFNRETRETMAVQDIRVGVTLKNLSSTFRWDSSDLGGSLGVIQDDKIPLEFGLSGSARFLSRKLLLASDLTKNTKQSFKYYGGAEYFLYPEFALRTGLADGRFTVGTGYVVALGGNALAIDYAFSTDKVGEGSEHIFSFDLIF